MPRAFHLVGLLLLWPLAAIAGEPSAPAEGADVLPLQPVEELKLPLSRPRRRSCCPRPSRRPRNQPRSSRCCGR